MANPNRGRNGSTSWIRKSTRFAIYHRDGWRCAYCPTRLEPGEATLDHIRPRSAQGHDLASNLITACRPCNFGRRDMPLVDFLAMGVTWGRREIANKRARKIRKQAARPLDREAGRTLAKFARALESL